MAYVALALVAVSGIAVAFSFWRQHKLRQQVALARTMVAEAKTRHDDLLLKDKLSKMSDEEIAKAFDESWKERRETLQN